MGGLQPHSSPIADTVICKLAGPRWGPENCNAGVLKGTEQPQEEQPGTKYHFPHRSAFLPTSWAKPAPPTHTLTPQPGRRSLCDLLEPGKEQAPDPTPL